MNNKLCNRKRYSLIELLVVIAILGILIGIATPAVINMFEKKKSERALQDMKGIAQSFKAFEAEYGMLPYAREYQEDSVTLVDGEFTAKLLIEELLTITKKVNTREIRFLQWVDNYIKKTDEGGEDGEPDNWLDPWGNPYVIALDYDGDRVVSFMGDNKEYHTLNGSIFILSAGADALTSSSDFENEDVLRSFIELGYDRNGNNMADFGELVLADTDNICSWK